MTSTQEKIQQMEQELAKLKEEQDTMDYQKVDEETFLNWILYCCQPDMTAWRPYYWPKGASFNIESEANRLWVIKNLALAQQKKD